MSPERAGPQRKLLHVFSTFGVGGAQTRAARLIRRLDHSVEHVLLATDGHLDGIDALRLADRVRFVPIALTKSHGVTTQNLMRIRALLRAEQPDLLLTYNFGAIEAALAHRLWPSCRHMHFEDGFGPDELADRQLARRVWLRRVALSGRTRIVVPSRTLERIARHVWRFAASRIECVPNGVDVDRFTPSASTDGPAGGLRVGAVGSLRPEKNFARLLRAVAAIPDTLVSAVLIAGDGPERSMLTALADRLGIASRVQFLGHVAQPEALLREIDLFAVTSDTEQMPLSLLEAMATALPVVATDVGDVRTMLPTSQHCFVVRRDDEQALAAGLVALAHDRGLGQQLGTANREHVCTHFHEDEMIRRYAQLFGVPATQRIDAPGTSF